MKKFLKVCLATASITLVLGLPCEIWSRHVPDNGIYTKKYTYLSNHRNDIKTLFLGHSHIEHGINPAYIGDSCYNMALAGRVIYFDKEILKKFAPIMPHLQTVVVPMDYTFQGFCAFYSDTDKELFNLLCNLYRKDMGIAHPGFNYHNIYFNHRFLHNQFINYHDDSLGFHPSVGTAGRYQTPLVQKKEEDFQDCLTEMADLCQRHHIRLIVVTTPCADAYLKATTKEGMERLNMVIEEVRRKAPLEYHNYIDDTAFRSDSLYGDNSHLNSAGAKKFSLRIKEDFGL